VRAAYLERAWRDPDRHRIVNAARPVETVRTEVESILAGWLEGA
jgi:thymidylate kinase